MTSDNESVLSSLSSEADVAVASGLHDEEDIDEGGEAAAMTENAGARSGTSPGSMLATSEEDSDAIRDGRRRHPAASNRDIGGGSSRKRQHIQDDDDDEDNADDDGSELSTLTSEQDDDLDPAAEDDDVDMQDVDEGNDDTAEAVQASHTLTVSRRRPKSSSRSSSTADRGNARPDTYSQANVQGSHAPSRHTQASDGQTSTHHFYGSSSSRLSQHNGSRKRRRPYREDAIHADDNDADPLSDPGAEGVSDGHGVAGDEAEDDDDLEGDEDDEGDDGLSDTSSDGEDDEDGLHDADRARARSARRARKRGRGRPPKRQNALTAAAKRQASKIGAPAGSQTSSDNDDYYEGDSIDRGNGGWPRQPSTQLSPGKERRHLELPASGEHSQQRIAHHSVETSEVGSTLRPNVDDQTDESVRLKFAASQNGTLPRSPPKQLQQFDHKHLLDGDHAASTGTTAAPSGIIEFANGMTLLADGLHRDDMDMSKGSRTQQLVDLDREDAMSGISDDVPIFVQAHARAAAAAAAAGENGRTDFYGSPDEDGDDLEEGEAYATYEHDLDLNRLHPPANGNRRRRSPSAHQANKARGKAALAKARSKKLYLQQQRAQGPGHITGEDVELSAYSANEEMPGDTDGGISPQDIDTAHPSDREDDNVVSKDRSDALDALARIEIEFAKIRNQLFVERMEEIARERYQIESGSHPELLHLMHLVEQRRHARLEMARKTLGVSDESHTRQSEGQYHGIWYDWTACRYSTSNAVMTEANHNRRRLDREKRAIERPRVEDLSSVLRLHAPPAHLYQERKATLAYGLDYAVEFDLHDSLYKREKRGAVGLDREEIMYDLQRSGLREAYPAMPYFAYAAPPPGGAAAAYMSGPHPHPTGDVNMLEPSAHLPDAPLHPLDAPGRTVNSVIGPSHSARYDMSNGSRHAGFLPNNTMDNMPYQGRTNQMFRA